MPLPSSPPLPPVAPLQPAEACLPSPEECAYQTPAPTISAMATTAATMMSTWLLSLPPPGPFCGPCGCIGIVGGCG